MYWNFKEFNDCWRLAKCNLFSKLRRHFDGALITSLNEKSIYTVMLYLNDADGEISFQNGLKFSPKLGRLIIFDQSLEHEGLPNEKEIKYFIRTELMYTREEEINTPNDTLGFEKYQEAKRNINLDEERAKTLEAAAFELSPILESMIFD
jgi:hypothetical protein